MPGAKLRLPKRLEETLKHNPGLHGAVLVSLCELEPWIADNKLPFFPEYTDHGPDHVNEVFVTAEALIRDEAWPHVTPEDVAVLVLGILLHDCAMHLSEEGFIALLKKKEWAAPVSPIDSNSWRELWDDFLREAARFDGKKLKKLFGDTEPARPPLLDTLAMSKRDRLLIGEFLRRHHPRLAHEIALQGVPGPTIEPLKLQNIDPKLSNLGGLVARSHGISLRAAAELLPNDERRETRSVHAPFLMSVLRIADYLQIHAERAPRKLLQVRSLQSPASVGEWKKHDAIETIHNRHDDPEALYVKALPKDAATYVALKRLFASIQEEVDDIWAVLGEVYGRVDDLRDFGIMIRRLRSNLDDEKAFAKTVDYVPGQAEFQAAGADLLKLLVGPLYGDKPELGVREILQNAVDACRELQDYLKHHPDTPMPSLTSQEADVVIAVDSTDSKWLRISDRGIGMTPTVVQDYFLRAGASFRNSDAWRRRHTDKSGHSRVLRSGRFGVGVLAAFLLGDRIEVSTRHVSQPSGIQFAAGIDDEVIELKYIDRPVGTSLLVRLRAEVTATSALYGNRWDWYCLASPSVVRKMLNDFDSSEPSRNDRLFPNRYSLPGAGDDVGASWRRIQHSEYADIQWAYDRWHPSAWEKRLPALACNGIIITDDLWLTRSARALFDSQDGTSVWFLPPAVSVFDPDGHLPLNLQRSALTTTPSFLDALYDDICKDFIAYLLVVAPSTPIDSVTALIRYPGTPTSDGDAPWLPVLMTATGWSIFDLWHLCAIRPASILVNSHDRSALRYSQAVSCPIVTFDCNGRNPYDNWIRGVLGRPETKIGPLTSLRELGRRILVPKASYQRLAEPGMIHKDLWGRTKIERSDKDWVVLRIGNCPAESPILENIASVYARSTGDFDSVAEWYLPEEGISPQEKPSRIARIWADTVKQAIIPFDFGERRRLLAHAYEALAPYIKAHEELAKRRKLADGR